MGETVDQPINKPEPFSQRITEIYGSPANYVGYFGRTGLQFDSDINRTAFEISYTTPNPFLTDPADKPKEPEGMFMMAFKRKSNFDSEQIERARINFDGTVKGDIDFIRFVNAVLQSADIPNIGADSNIAPATLDRKRIVEEKIKQRQKDLQAALNKYDEVQKTSGNT